jgi:hypothetical protein
MLTHLRRLFAFRSPVARRTQPRRTRPGLEALEERMLLSSTVNYDPGSRTLAVSTDGWGTAIASNSGDDLHVYVEGTDYAYTAGQVSCVILTAAPRPEFAAGELNTTSLSVSGLPAGVSLTVNGNGYLASASLDGLDTIHGSVNINFGQPTWGFTPELKVYDDTSSISHTYTFTAGALARDGATAVSFSGSPVGVDLYPAAASQTNIQGVASGNIAGVANGGGTQTVTVGNNGSMQSILGDVYLRYDNGGPASFNLNLNDGADPTARTVTVDQFLNKAASFNGTLVETVSGLAPGAVHYESPDLDPYSVTLTTGTASDTVNVLRATAALNITTTGGHDTVNVGHDGTVQDVNGTLTVTNPPSYTTLNIDDHADAAARTVTVTSGSVTGLAPGAINYQQYDLQALNITGGSGSNNFTVTSTPYNPHVSTTINSGSGGNLVNVYGTNGPLNVVGGASGDYVNVGNGNNSVQGIQGTLTVTNPPSYTTLNIYDSADTVGRTLTVTSGGITGLAPAAINYQQYDLQALNVYAGTGRNRFVINSTPSNYYLTTSLYGGSGSNTMQIGNGTQGRLYLYGGGNGTLDDTTYTGNVTVDLLLGSATGASAGVLGFENVYGGLGNNLIVGGGANDVLTGGPGNNLIIDGWRPAFGDPATSHAQLNGGNWGNNLLIGGYTSYDQNLTALNALFAEWTRTDETLDQRIAHLRYGGGLNGSYVLNSSTVFEGSAQDTLSGANLPGATATTWFLAGAIDVLLNQHPGDRVN